MKKLFDTFLVVILALILFFGISYLFVFHKDMFPIIIGIIFFLFIIFIMKKHYPHYFTKINRKNFIPIHIVLIILFVITIIIFYFIGLNNIGILPTIGMTIFLNVYLMKTIFFQFYSIKKKSKSILIIPTILWAIGLIGFISGFNVSLFLYKIIPDSFEMPLGDLKGLAVDSEGNIYCGTQFYSRFQVYNRNGRFLYGKCFDSGGGAFKIKINSDDKIEIMTYRGQIKYLFDKDGTLLYKRENSPSYKVGFEQVDDFYCYDRTQEITYQLKPILLPPVILAHSTLISPFGSHVLKKDASGKQTVIIQSPFHKWLFMGPSPAFLIMIISGLLLSSLDQDFRNNMMAGMKRKNISNTEI